VIAKFSITAENNDMHIYKSEGKSYEIFKKCDFSKWWQGENNK